MKTFYLLVILFFFLPITLVAQQINWITLEDAVKLQEKTPRKILIDVYTNWCGPCKLLDKRTFKNTDVANYINTHYYAVKFNAEGNEVVKFKDSIFTNPKYDKSRANKRNAAHQLTSYFGVRAYPTIVFLDEKSNFITPISGFRDTNELEFYLKMFKDDDHKNFNSQEDFNTYYKAFQPKFTQ